MRWTANAGLIFTVLVWGTPIPLYSYLLQRWDPLLVALLRYALALPFLLLLIWLIELRGSGSWRLRPEGIGWGRLFLLGGGMAVFSLFFVLGLANCDPVTAAVLAATSPILAGLISWLVYRQRPGVGLGVGVVLAVLGGLLAGVDLTALGRGITFLGGEPLLLIALACWAWYSITAQRWIRGASQLRLTLVTLLPATAMLLLFYLAMLASGIAPGLPTAREPGDTLLITWIAVSGVALGIMSWNYGVRRLGVVVASMFLNLIPVVAVLTAMLLGTQPTSAQLLGGLLVVAGVAQSQLRVLLRGKTAAGATD